VGRIIHTFYHHSIFSLTFKITVVII